MSQHPPTKETILPCLQKTKIANCTQKQITAVCQPSATQGFGVFRINPGIRTNKKKSHAEATHNNCPSKPKYRSPMRDILPHTARKCVTIVLTSSCVQGKQRSAASLRFAHATNLMPPAGLDHCRKGRRDCSRN